MSNDDKSKRALYLKGIIVGKTAMIELVKPLSGRDADDKYVHFAEKGDRVRATMTQHGWEVDLGGRSFNIPFENGKFRSV